MPNNFLHATDQIIQIFLFIEGANTDADRAVQQIFAAWTHAHAVLDRFWEVGGTIEGTAVSDGPLIEDLGGGVDWFATVHFTGGHPFSLERTYKGIGQFASGEVGKHAERMTIAF